MLASRIGLRGREPEFDQLTTALGRALSGTPFVVTVEGEAGIGKSRLVDEATQAVSGMRVLRGKASALEHERPFGPLIDAFGLRSRDLAAVGPQSPEEATPTRHFAVADHFLDLFERASADGPVVLVLEDLHWADAATLSLAARIARQRGPLNTSLVCTRRPSPRSPDLEALLKSLADEGATEMRLGPLPDSAVIEIVAEVAGASPGPTLSARVRGASGNPLYVIELVEGMSGDLTSADGVADVPDASTAPSLPLTIIRRLGLLPAETIELLRRAAILGASFDLAELTVVARRPALELVSLLQPAIDSDVLIATTDGFRFRHDVIHESAYADIPLSVRRALHADAAAALAAEPGADVMHVARHFELATDGPDATVSDWLWNAATATFALDRRTSLDLMSRSLARTPPDHQSLLERRVLEAARGINLGGEARLDRARTLLREPLPDQHRWAVEAGLVSGLALAGRAEEAEQLAFAAPRPQTARLTMAVALVGAHCLLGDPNGADRVIDNLAGPASGDEEDELLLRQYGGNRHDSREFFESLTSFCRGFVAWARGENGTGPTIARRCEELSRRIGAPPQALDGAALILGSDASGGEWRDSLRWLGSVASHAFPEIDAGAGFAYWLAGEWDEALAYFETALGRADEGGPRLADTLYPIPALIEAERGHADDARAWLVRSQTLPSSSGLATWASAVLAEAEGDLDLARQLLTEAWRRDSGAGTRVWQRLYAADLLRHAADARDEVMGAEVVAVVEALVPRGGDIAVATAMHCRALKEGSGADLVAAAGLFRRFGRPVEAARAEEDAAVAVASSDAPRAQELVDSATAVYEAVGARRDLARLARRLRMAGMPRKARPAPRPVTGWESLTKSELRVAELVSHGLTYRAIGERLFVSRRTVETHVAHVFAKLAVRSKAELASAYVARFGA